MTTPSVHFHAIQRLKERFDADDSWLLNELKQGRFVWLKGAGDSGNEKKIRSGHLIYIPAKDEYCVVVMDDRARLAITVLTEKMALNSPWGKGLDRAAKLKAKKIALGEATIKDINFLLLYAEDRGELSVNVQARTVSYNWNPIMLSIYKTSIICEQIDIANNCCILSDKQIIEVSRSITEKIDAKEMRPYAELSLSTGHGKSAAISNKLNCISELENAESARRWGELM